MQNALSRININQVVERGKVKKETNQLYLIAFRPLSSLSPPSSHFVLYSKIILCEDFKRKSFESNGLHGTNLRIVVNICVHKSFLQVSSIKYVAGGKRDRYSISKWFAPLFISPFFLHTRLRHRDFPKFLSIALFQIDYFTLEPITQAPNFLCTILNSNKSICIQ